MLSARDSIAPSSGIHPRNCLDLDGHSPLLPKLRNAYDGSVLIAPYDNLSEWTSIPGGAGAVSRHADADKREGDVHYRCSVPW